MLLLFLSTSKLSISILNSITGTPQGDGISPVLFIVYLEYVMRELRELLEPILKHADLPIQIFELGYSDDMNITSTNREFTTTILELATPTFARHDLDINQEKTEVRDLTSTAHIINDQDPLYKGTKNYKMLGTYLDPDKMSTTESP